jgi:hypothetical protein
LRVPDTIIIFPYILFNLVFSSSFSVSLEVKETYEKISNSFSSFISSISLSLLSSYSFTVLKIVTVYFESFQLFLDQRNLSFPK